MKWIVVLCVVLSLFNNVYAQSYNKAVKVEIITNDNKFQLLRNGNPYFVKGAGGSSEYIHRLAAYGGNSIRTWGTDKGKEILDTAGKYGVTVMMGLWVAHERHGFNYNDTAAVRKQLERFRTEVRKLKDHPALLVWGIGNEVNLNYQNLNVWNAVNDIAKMIHEEDPNHPVCTVLAGIDKNVISAIKTQCPDIDFLAINTYGDLARLPQHIRNYGWNKAYMVTEWGPTGHWESLETPWKAAIEETSTEKAAVYKSRYEYSINRDKEKCLGSYVFLWGQKQERTPTWYGIFTDKGEETGVADVMQYLWRGDWPRNIAPVIYSLNVNNKKVTDFLYVKSGDTCTAKALAFDPDNDKLTYRWEILPESGSLKDGGDNEIRPVSLKNLFKGNQGHAAISFIAPAEKGAYRLFIYINDGRNKVATANFPFYVNN